MRVYFLRHADALDGDDDALRPLSPKGKDQCRRLGRWLQQADIDWDVAFSSPLLRAQQTATLVLQAADSRLAGQFTEASALCNETSAVTFNRWLRGLSQHESVLLVGHAPTLAERVRGLLSMENEAALSLPKAGLACVETDDGRHGILKLYITPKVL